MNADIVELLKSFVHERHVLALMSVCHDFYNVIDTFHVRQSLPLFLNLSNRFTCHRRYLCVLKKQMNLQSFTNCNCLKLNVIRLTSNVKLMSSLNKLHVHLGRLHWERQHSSPSYDIHGLCTLRTFKLVDEIQYDNIEIIWSDQHKFKLVTNYKHIILTLSVAIRRLVIKSSALVHLNMTNELKLTHVKIDNCHTFQWLPTLQVVKLRNTQHFVNEPCEGLKSLCIYHHFNYTHLPSTLIKLSLPSNDIHEKLSDNIQHLNVNKPSSYLPSHLKYLRCFKLNSSFQIPSHLRTLICEYTNYVKTQDVHFHRLKTFKDKSYGENRLPCLPLHVEKYQGYFNFQSTYEHLTWLKVDVMNNHFNNLQHLRTLKINHIENTITIWPSKLRYLSIDALNAPCHFPDTLKQLHIRYNFKYIFLENIPSRLQILKLTDFNDWSENMQLPFTLKVFNAPWCKLINCKISLPDELQVLTVENVQLEVLQRLKYLKTCMVDIIVC